VTCAVHLVILYLPVYTAVELLAVSADTVLVCSCSNVIVSE